MENGGNGMSEVVQLDENGEAAKRPRYESQQRGVTVGYATPASQQQGPQPMAVPMIM